MPRSPTSLLIHSFNIFIRFSTQLDIFATKTYIRRGITVIRAKLDQLIDYTIRLIIWGLPEWYNKKSKIKAENLELSHMREPWVWYTREPGTRDIWTIRLGEQGDRPVYGIGGPACVEAAEEGLLGLLTLLGYRVLGLIGWQDYWGWYS